MLFRQLFESVSSTYTYLLACEETGQAALIDPVLPAWQRDLMEIRRLGLTLAYTIDTHIHADHITAAQQFKSEVGSCIAHPAHDALECADIVISEGTTLRFGNVRIAPLHTPGHTDGHHAYHVADRVFTGDALLIEACGRTDFQNGDARSLYESVHNKLFSLPDETLVYPAHDYSGRYVTSIAQEKIRNPRLGNNRPLDEFVKLMNELDLDYPKFIDYALPGNQKCGICPDGLPKDLQQYCDQMGASRQG